MSLDQSNKVFMSKVKSKVLRIVILEDISLWLEKIDSFRKIHLNNFFCILHTDGAFPQQTNMKGVNLLSSGTKSFLIFGNKNHVYELNHEACLKKAALDLGAYGYIKVYFVANENRTHFLDLVKDRKISTYFYSYCKNECFLSNYSETFKSFVEFETSLEGRVSPDGQELTYLSIYHTDTITELPLCAGDEVLS